MRCRGLNCPSVWLWALAAMVAVSSTAWGQDTEATGIGGVFVDADGVLHMKTVTDPNGQLRRERMESARATLDPKLTQYSKLRKIALNRLERAITDHGGAITDEMRNLAGLQRVKYVFYYPESKDIVLAGPAEGWARDAFGRSIGISSQRPVVMLEDLVVALRAFPPGGRSGPVIGCSIDPTREGLTAMQQFLAVNRPDMSQPEPFVEALRTALGNQLVSIQGVSPKTHFAQVLIEADYRMKLIGIGLEQPPVKLVSYVERAKPSDVGRNALQRWFFVPDYQCIRESADKLAIELVGDGVKLIGEDEMVTAGGERRHAGGRANRASHDFVAGFTQKYPELAERSPVYAELRNLIDLSIAAAYVQSQDYYGKAGWKLEFLGNDSSFPVETYDIPKTVESAVNAVWKGQVLMTPIGGGVSIQAAQALRSDNLLRDEKGQVGKLHESAVPNLADGQWWWD